MFCCRFGWFRVLLPFYNNQVRNSTRGREREKIKRKRRRKNGFCSSSEIGIVLHRSCSGVVSGALHSSQWLQGCPWLHFPTGISKTPKDQNFFDICWWVSLNFACMNEIFDFWMWVLKIFTNFVAFHKTHFVDYGNSNIWEE